LKNYEILGWERIAYDSCGYGGDLNSKQRVQKKTFVGNVNFSGRILPSNKNIN
jgi:hypothetical protein